VGELDPENLPLELNSPVHKNLIPLISRDSIVERWRGWPNGEAAVRGYYYYNL